LFDELKSLQEKLINLRTGIESLAGELGEPVPSGVGKSLELLTSLTSGTFGNFADFHEAAEETFAGSPKASGKPCQSFRKFN